MKTNRNIWRALFLIFTVAGTSCSGKEESSTTREQAEGKGKTTLSETVPADTNKTRVSVYLKDGSTIQGFLLLDSISLKTQYAILALDVRLISTIEHHDTDNLTTISLASGDRLGGSLLHESLPVGSIMGVLTVKTRDLSRVAVIGTGLDFDSALLAFYAFTGDAKDKSGHGHDGIVRGSRPCNDRFGNGNSAYAFDGNEAHISIPDGIISHDIAEFSVSVWLLCKDLHANRVALYIGAKTGEACIRLSDGKVAFFVDLATEWFDVAAEVIPRDWVHVVAVYRRGKSIEIWINAEKKGESPIPAKDLFHNGRSHFSSIGSYAPDNFNHAHATGTPGWLGAIDQVRIVSRALTPGEIKTIFASDK